MTPTPAAPVLPWMRQLDVMALVLAKALLREYPGMAFNRSIPSSVPEDRASTEHYHATCIVEVIKPIIARFYALAGADDHADKLAGALKHYQSSLKALSESPGKQECYFELSPIKDAECHRRWLELNKAGCEAIAALAAHEARRAALAAQAAATKQGDAT